MDVLGVKKEPVNPRHALTGPRGRDIFFLLPFGQDRRVFCAPLSSLKSEQTVSREDVTCIRRLTRASGVGSLWCGMFHSDRTTNILS